MSSFSENFGFRAKKFVQDTTMDAELRTGLWNVMHVHFWSATEHNTWFGCVPTKRLEPIVRELWSRFFKVALTDLNLHRWEEVLNEIRSRFESMEWYRVYDIIEFLSPHSAASGMGKEQFVADCNDVLQREQSAYRVICDSVVPITHSVEIQEVEMALNSSVEAVRHQIDSALKKLSIKPVPDTRNSIKESIGAVETAARLAADDEKATLGKVLGVLQKQLDLHKSQVDGFKALYGYTSDDESGIRHGMMDKDDLTPDDARYMLVICSAFSNYLLQLAERSKSKCK